MTKDILRIDMSRLTAVREKLPEKWARWAGRALTSAIVFDEVDPTCHPLGPYNKLVFAPGWVTGTPAAPSSGRTSFGAKSPLTGGIKESNAGGREVVHPGHHQGRRAVRGRRRPDRQRHV